MQTQADMPVYAKLIAPPAKLPYTNEKVIQMPKRLSNNASSTGFLRLPHPLKFPFSEGKLCGRGLENQVKSDFLDSL